MLKKGFAKMITGFAVAFMFFFFGGMIILVNKYIEITKYDIVNKVDIRTQLQVVAGLFFSIIVLIVTWIKSFSERSKDKSGYDNYILGLALGAICSIVISAYIYMSI